ncbi:MAG TPA: hypothetical protein VIG51_11155 [Candidatus Baltobacteraceae bacterium]
MRTVQAKVLIVLLFLGLTGAAAQAASLKIENETDTPIYKVYISPSSYTSFDLHDYLGDNIIESSETWVVQWRAGDICHWDFRVIFRNGQRATSYGNNLCVLNDPIWHVTASNVDDSGD